SADAIGYGSWSSQAQSESSNALATLLTTDSALSGDAQTLSRWALSSASKEASRSSADASASCVPRSGTGTMSSSAQRIKELESDLSALKYVPVLLTSMARRRLETPCSELSQAVK